MTDAVTLTLPFARPYYGVVRLVAGGLAARLDLSFEELGDVQIALESVLTNEAYAAGRDVTVMLAMAAGGLELSIGPLDAARLAQDLDSDLDESGGVSLRRLLTTLMAGFEVDHRDGGDWLRMTKDVARPGMATAP